MITFQAVLIADNFSADFLPHKTVSLIPLFNVPLVEYALESLYHSGVEKVFLVVSRSIDQVKAFLLEAKKQNKKWSIYMKVELVISRRCSCFGDALRDLHAKGLVKSHFVLMGAGTVTNAKLKPIFETNIFKDGVRMTVIYKRIPGNQPTGDNIMIATDANTNRLLFYHKFKPDQKNRRFNLPSEKSDIIVHHDLIDPQIAICHPDVLELFANNFNYRTIDDFIRKQIQNGITGFINVEQLPKQQYARTVTDWQLYHMISDEIMNRWVSMGICNLDQQFAFLQNKVYNKNKNDQHERDVKLNAQANVYIHDGSSVSNGSILNSSVVGKNCKIGSNCQINHAFLFDGVQIDDNVTLEYCVIGKNSKIGKGSKIDQGTIVGDNCVIPPNTILSKTIARSTKPDEYEKICDKLYVLKSDESPEVASDHEENDKIIKMSQCESIFTDEAPSPMQDVSKLFFSEIMEILKRGLEKKCNSKLIRQELDSLCFGWSMFRSEVELNVIKAFLILLPLQQGPTDLFSKFEHLMKYLGPVVQKYFHPEPFLKVFEEICAEVPALKSNGGLLLHYFYDNDLLYAYNVIQWFRYLDDKSPAKTDSVANFIEFLELPVDSDDSEDRIYVYRLKTNEK